MRRKQSSQSGRASSLTSTEFAPSDTYLGLRNQVLHSSRTQLGLPATSDSSQPWALLMDWGTPKGSVTVVALSDGNASVYLSSGGGYIGGFSHEPIRNAAQMTVTAAGEAHQLMHVTTNYPLPQAGEVFFYALTDSGVFTASGQEDDMKNGRSSLSKLANAAQGVITQYRLMQDAK